MLEKLITYQEIKERCKQLGKEITTYYQDQEFIMLGILKGSVPFMALLQRYIDSEYVENEFMKVSSYFDGTTSTGEIKIIKDLERAITDVKVLIVEDIVDTGITLNTIKELLYSKGAKEVKIVSLLDKPSRREKAISPDWCGFEIENHFVVGFGLDFNEKYRTLEDICILKED